MSTTTEETTMSTTDDIIQEQVNLAAAGEASGAVIYWDTLGEPEGPSYRACGESGALEFVGWGGADTAGYDDNASLVNYFNDGEYLGPDHYGVHPVFRV